MMTTKRLLVTGGRHWVDEETMTAALATAYRDLGGGYIVLVHGAARGADTMAARLWEARGLATEAHPADWDRLRRAAGGIRNQEMVDRGADLALAFPDPKSKGTWDCVRRIEAAGIELRVFNQKPVISKRIEGITFLSEQVE